jgi:CHAD domain-containing protein
MREYVRQQTAILLRRLAYEVNRAARNAEEEAIHDLRVAIRRLSRCLQLFSGFYPGRSWQKVRRRLSETMDCAGAVRDCDIAAKLLAQAGVQAGTPVFKRLGADRRAAVRDLTADLRHWKQRSFSKKWRAQLGL